MQIKFFRDFNAKILQLNRTRKRLETLFNNNLITTRDMEPLYEAMFLRLITSFEKFLDLTFTCIIQKKSSYDPARVSHKISADDPDYLLQILLRGDDYLDWLPYQKTEDRAKLFLIGGKPFTIITDNSKRILKECYSIRNAIAHNSLHSIQIFEKIALNNLHLPSRERSPAGYLRSLARNNPDISRIEIYYFEIGLIAKTISQY